MLMVESQTDNYINYNSMDDVLRYI